MLKQVDARQVKRWLDGGQAVLIDIRESDEYAREHILGSQLVPLSGFDAADFPGITTRSPYFTVPAATGPARRRRVSSAAASRRSTS